MADSVRINLGLLKDVRNLFSYPNNCNEICFLKQSLEDTVSHYVKSSIKRDAFDQTDVRAFPEGENLIVEVEGEAASLYANFFEKYLSIGKLGFEASLQLRAEERWLYNWRFFLPHGVAMTRHYTVQLLHFPPDYVLERDQDYLSASTTLRWAALLEENGATSNETPQFQNIIDIAPIAAPSDAGQKLDGIYSYYDNYIIGLLKLWVPDNDGNIRPMVAFGSPVRLWIKSKYTVDLDVLSFAVLNIADGLNVPTLAANHPSFIYNAAKRLEDDPNTPDDERIGVLMRIMQQDLIAANWQVLMGKNPNADPVETLNTCRQTWSSSDKQKRICELTYQQALNRKPDEAETLCAKLPIAGLTKMFGFVPEISTDEYDNRIKKLQSDIGSQDSREPDVN
jgi:hypothetical protein